MNSKNISAFFIAIVLAAALSGGCGKKDTDTKQDEVKIPEKGTTLYATVDRLRIRETPDLKGKVVKRVTWDEKGNKITTSEDYLVRKGSGITFTGEVSDRKFTVKLGGKEITAPFYRINITDMYETVIAEGWVFAGAVSAEYSTQPLTAREQEEDNFRRGLGDDLIGQRDLSEYFAEKVTVTVKTRGNCSGSGQAVFPAAELAGTVKIPLQYGDKSCTEPADRMIDVQHEINRTYDSSAISSETRDDIYYLRWGNENGSMQLTVKNRKITGISYEK